MAGSDVCKGFLQMGSTSSVFAQLLPVQVIAGGDGGLIVASPF